MTTIRNVLAVSALTMVLGRAAMAGPRDLLNLSTAALGDSLPPLWQRRAVRGSHSPTSRVREHGGDRFLFIRGQHQAAWFAIDLRRLPLTHSGSAQLEYRLPVIPAGTDLSISARSDAALRLYFVLEGTRRVLPTTRLLMYSMGTLNDGVRVKRTGNLCDIRLPRSQTVEWQRLAVSPAADAARDCQWNDGRIVAVGFMQDTDQTGSLAEAHIRTLVWNE